MKLTVFILLLGCLQASAVVHAQSITLSLNKASFPSFIEEVEAQTGYRFVYLKEQMEKTSSVTLHVINRPLLEVLSLTFKDQPLDFTIEDKLIIIRNKKQQQPALPVIELRGRVLSREGEPMAGITIRLKDGSRATVTDESGEFALREIDGSAILEISGAEIEKMEVPVNGKQYLTITVKIKVSKLDQVIVMAYGQTTQRLNTGNITKVTAEEIERQPVSNPLAALQGRVPGMVVTQTSGVPGSAFKVEIRGRSSLDLSLSRNDPLFIIDGVPFEPGNGAMNIITSATNNPTSISEGGLSPLNMINPADIESIEVLKDGDATAIYGSRAANGIIIITTKKGSSGRLTINSRFYTGFSRITRTMDMLTTKDYLEMRKEAFKNDNFTPNIYNAMDVLIWDSTVYTDLKKRLIGGTAQTTDAQLSLSGGSGQTNFLIGTGYQKESTVYSDSYYNQRMSFHLNMGHQSKDARFKFSVSGNFSSNKNILPPTDFSRYMYLPPNIPLHNEDGSIRWSDKGVNFSDFGFSNPLAEFLKTNRSTTENFMVNFSTGYEIFKNFSVKTNIGYNFLHSEEVAMIPKTALDPTLGQKASSQFANSSIKSWIAEPHLNYTLQAGLGKFDFLAGGSWQEKALDVISINATNYTSDQVLYSIGAAGNIRSVNNTSEYRYQGIFGRINYNHSNKYLANISIRQDGSSRFGPGKRFANFFSVGGGWVFSDYNIIKDNLSFLSFGKIRGSYGTSGNDQIGDYRFYDLWTNTVQYQQNPGFFPSVLFNPNLSWESTHKFEFGAEIGLIKDKVLFSTAYYRHRSRNQLISYQLPTQTGFTGVVKNLDALVENSGWEFYLTSRIIQSTYWNWNVNFNLTIPKNILLAFPGLEESSYASQYEIGKPIGIVKRYHYLGVSPANGTYIIEDVNGDGIYSPADYRTLIHTNPKYYGGFSTSIQHKSIELSASLEFRNQVGRNYLSQLASGYIPGTAANQPTIVLQRWQKPGDITNVQKYSVNAISEAALASRTHLSVSDGIYSNASFLKCRNIQISWRISDLFNKSSIIKSCKFYVSGQNIFTLTNYSGFDPETQSIYQLPPLKTLVAGIQFTL